MGRAWQRWLSTKPGACHTFPLLTYAYSLTHQPTHSLTYSLIHSLTVWVVEPVVTHQTSWLESTCVCDVRQNQARSLAHSLTHSPTHPPTHSLTHSSTHSSTHLSICCSFVCLFALPGLHACGHSLPLITAPGCSGVMFEVVLFHSVCRT